MKIDTLAAQNKSAYKNPKAKTKALQLNRNDWMDVNIRSVLLSQIAYPPDDACGRIHTFKS